MKLLKTYPKLSMLIIASILPVFCAGQTNLVPNPSFEDTVFCPFAAGDIDKSDGWVKWGSPDYFHTCNEFAWGVPYNVFGYQFPASGIAYGGFVTYSTNFPDTREFIAHTLSSPLIIGQKYFISFKIALSLDDLGAQTNCASDKIGAMFSTYFNETAPTPPFLTNNPPIYTDSIISDTLDWTRITGSFIADSTYTYFIIGNFFDDVNTDTVKFFNDFSDNAYYYLDDICVSTDSAFAFNYNYTSGISDFNLSTQITVYPNPITDYLTIQNNLNESIDIDIYNVLGELVYSTQNMTEKTFSINLSEVHKGLLLANIRTDSQSINYKLLKL